MSVETPRPSQDPAAVTATERRARHRIRVIARLASLLACGSAHAFALELGEAVVRSALGQPLVVYVPYRLAPGEQLTPACIGLAPAPRADRALPTYSRVSRIALTATDIEIHGDARVLEPLIGLTVDVRCNTAPRFARSYELFVDPPTRMPTTITGGLAVAAGRRAPDAAMPVAERPDATLAALPAGAAPSDSIPAGAQSTPPRTNVAARARGQTGDTLAQGQTYTVVRGDTLSGIAARVGDRPTTIRATADAIHAANPEAFTRGNRDLIEAGRAITIPIMSATTAVPAPASAAPAPVARDLDAPAPLALPTPSTTATELPRAAASVDVVVPESTAPALASVAQPNAAPPPTPRDVTADAAIPVPSPRTSMWLTVLLALGATLLLAAPVLFVRRHKRGAAAQAPPEQRVSHPRQLVDPVAGFDVIEGRLGRTQTSEKLTATSTTAALPVDSRAVAADGPESGELDIAPSGTVDLDIGAPLAADDHVERFAAGTATTATAAAPGGDDTLETTATTRMAQPDVSITVSVPTLESKSVVATTAIDDDEQHTLTIAEVEVLRQDYETEHTLTQEASKALRDALADLKATQAARAAAGATATLEMPQSHAESHDGSSDRALGRRRSGGR